MDKDLKSWWEELKADLSLYIEARTQLTKIQVYEKIAKILGVVISFFILALLIGFVIIFILIMIGSWVIQLTGSVAIGMSSVALIIIFSFILLSLKRKSWLEVPISNKVIHALYDEEHVHEVRQESDGVQK